MRTARLSFGSSPAVDAAEIGRASGLDAGRRFCADLLGASRMGVLDCIAKTMGVRAGLDGASSGSSSCFLASTSSSALSIHASIFASGTFSSRRRAINATSGSWTRSAASVRSGGSGVDGEAGALRRLAGGIAVATPP